MTTTYTEQGLRIVAKDTIGWDDEINDNTEFMSAIISSLTSGSGASGIAATNGGGLTVNYASGTANVAGTAYAITASTKTATALTSTATTQRNFLYVDSGGVMQISTTAPTGDFALIAVVDTDVSAIVAIYDYRYNNIPYPLVGAVGNINNPLLHLPLKNSLAFAQGVGAVTFTRSTTGTYVDRYGVVQTAAIDEPRFEKEGLLIEGASTNVCLQSQTLATTWTNVGVTITSDSIAAPDGTTTAEKLDDTDASLNVIFQPITCADDSLPTTASFFIKAGTSLKCQVGFVFIGGTNVASELSINQDMSVDSISAGTYTVKQLADGWYRYTITNSNNSSGNTTCQPFIYPASTSAAATGYIYAWGVQVEKRPFATSYIPTTTAAATRTADITSLTLAGNMPLLADEALTIIADCDSFGNYTGPLWATETTGGSAVAMGVFTTGTSMLARAGGSAVISTLMTGISANGFTDSRVGIVMTASNVGGYVDGASVDNDAQTVNSEVSVSNPIYLGYRHDAISWYGHISNFRIYDQALTAEEMRVA